MQRRVKNLPIALFSLISRLPSDTSAPSGGSQPARPFPAGSPRPKGNAQDSSMSRSGTRRTGDRVGDVVQQRAPADIAVEVLSEQIGLPLEPADSSGGIVWGDPDGRM